MMQTRSHAELTFIMQEIARHWAPEFCEHVLSGDLSDDQIETVFQGILSFLRKEILACGVKPKDADTCVAVAEKELVFESARLMDIIDRDPEVRQ